MSNLIKGNMIMKNVAKKDIDMYVKAGWKLLVPKKKENKKPSEIKNAEDNNSNESVEEKH